MNKYIVLVRSLNVGKKNRIKMEILKAALIGDGLFDVKTYIQSGNIVLESELDANEVKMLVEDILYEDFDIDTRCRVVLHCDLKECINEELYEEFLGERVFISLCDPDFKFEVETMNEKEDIVILEVHDNVIISCAKIIDGKTPDVNYFLENLSKAGTITRNTKIIKALLEM
ncbi:MAG: DUF1697 domain-containing protein [Mycoplasmatales bacterium]